MTGESDDIGAYQLESGDVNWLVTFCQCDHSLFIQCGCGEGVIKKRKNKHSVLTRTASRHAETPLHLLLSHRVLRFALNKRTLARLTARTSCHF